MAKKKFTNLMETPKETGTGYELVKKLGTIYEKSKKNGSKEKVMLTIIKWPTGLTKYSLNKWTLVEGKRDADTNWVKRSGFTMDCDQLMKLKEILDNLLKEQNPVKPRNRKEETGDK